MSYKEEFAVVDLVLASNATTYAVDAFTLSVVKMERQIRRLFTYLVYQSEAFGPQHVDALRKALGQENYFYFEGFERGIDALLPSSIADLIGEEYLPLREAVDEAVQIRNKVFHGQLTDRCLQRDDLIKITGDIRRWCQLVAEASDRVVGYDGFGRSSFAKRRLGLAETYSCRLESIDDYKAFLDLHVRRRRDRARS